MINDMDKKVIKRKTKKGIYMKIMGKAAYQQRKRWSSPIGLNNKIQAQY